jgi:hypothetical protein
MWKCGECENVEMVTPCIFNLVIGNIKLNTVGDKDEI